MDSYFSFDDFGNNTPNTLSC